MNEDVHDLRLNSHGPTTYSSSIQLRRAFIGNCLQEAKVLVFGSNTEAATRSLRIRPHWGKTSDHDGKNLLAN
jgi:hypothetical protein